MIKLRIKTLCSFVQRLISQLIPKRAFIFSTAWYLVSHPLVVGKIQSCREVRHTYFRSLGVNNCKYRGLYLGYIYQERFSESTS
jgi:hypothetical protein